jgi:hypothetical protein
MRFGRCEWTRDELFDGLDLGHDVSSLLFEFCRFQLVNLGRFQKCSEYCHGVRDRFRYWRVEELFYLWYCVSLNLV